jgi:peptide/nickel transport system substrate-binding protein
MNILQQVFFYISSLFLALLPTTEYVEGIVGQPQNFFPHQTVSQNDKTISSLIYRGLFKYDIYGSLIPDLAESWAISDDGLIYTIKLKGNQYWSDGQHINSDDLIYTAFKTPDLQGVATDKVDDFTVRYTLPNRFSPFLSMLTNGVMQSGSEENYSSLTPASSGPFRVVQVQKNGPIIKEVVLVTRQKDIPIKKISFRYYGSDDELYTAARLGEINGFLSNRSYDGMLENFSNYKFPIQGVYYALYFNLEDDVVSNLELRQNLEKTIEMDPLIYDKGIVVQGPISRSPFTDKEVTSSKFDKDFKQDLQRLQLTITVPDIGGHKDFARRVREVWKSKLNIDLVIEVVDPEAFVDEVIIPRDYQILFYGQEVPRDPDRYVNWHSAQKENPGLNLSKFEHIRSDRALEEGRNIIDNDERLVHYYEFQKVVTEQVPAIFMYHPYRNFYVSKKITGIGHKYTFSGADRFLDFSNWKFVGGN